jgi:hypothetical protein
MLGHRQHQKALLVVEGSVLFFCKCNSFHTVLVLRFDEKVKILAIFCVSLFRFCFFDNFFFVFLLDFVGVHVLVVCAVVSVPAAVVVERTLEGGRLFKFAVPRLQCPDP